jgi:hypothetical protein
MTNLMHQLQAWADEGRYDWENGTFNFKGTERFHPYLSMDEDQQEKYHTLDWKALVQLVLDGTIQVWRPVEHYPPPENAEVLALFLVSENAGYEHGIVETNVEKGFTHWQPLPNSELVARLKGGER